VTPRDDVRCDRVKLLRSCDIYPDTGGLASDHWLTAPFVLSFRLLNIQSAFLVNHRNFGDAIGWTREYSAKHLIIEPEIVTDMNTGLDTAVRHIFDTVWQAFGAQRCAFYDPDGTRTPPAES
jgi:hypothetical protein